MGPLYQPLLQANVGSLVELQLAGEHCNVPRRAFACKPSLRTVQRCDISHLHHSPRGEMLRTTRYTCHVLYAYLLLG
jgi:hypothetical protein